MPHGMTTLRRSLWIALTMRLATASGLSIGNNHGNRVLTPSNIPVVA